MSDNVSHQMSSDLAYPGLTAPLGGRPGDVWLRMLLCQEGPAPGFVGVVSEVSSPWAVGASTLIAALPSQGTGSSPLLGPATGWALWVQGGWEG